MSKEAQTPAPTLSGAARKLSQALRRETGLARSGALPELAAAAEAKEAAFRLFLAARDARSETAPVEQTERAAVRDLLDAADENALVLEAVRATLDDVAEKLRRALSSAADPGLYGPTGRGPRHTLAAQVDATI